MRYALWSAVGLLLGASGLVLLPAQTTNADDVATQHERQQLMIGFLPQAEQDRVVNAYEKAMAADPSLKTEANDLLQDAMTMQDPSPEDRQAFKEKIRAYQETVRKAMLKADPGLLPLLEKIDKHVSEMRAAHAKSGGAAGP